MDWLEQELQQALQRKDPSADFAERVLAKAREPRRPVFTLPRWIPVAAALLTIAGGGAAYRHHEGTVAKDQVMLAMRITADKLNHVQSRVHEVHP